MRHRLLPLVVVVCALGLIAGCGRDVPPVPGTSSIAAADREAPLVIAGVTLDGSPLDLADYRGRVVILNNWASWCAPCREETPILVDLAGSVDPADVAVVGLNVTDEESAARAFADEFAMPYPSIVDADGTMLASIPGIPPAALPSTVVLDRDGRIAARIIGKVDAADLSAIVTSVAGEAAPSAPSG